jgi:hypothetical protein
MINGEWTAQGVGTRVPIGLQFLNMIPLHLDDQINQQLFYKMQELVRDKSGLV